MRGGKACRTDFHDFHDFHETAWQHAPRNLRYSVEHFADIENVRKRVEKAVENFKARSRIVILRRPIRKMVPSPHGRALYSSDRTVDAWQTSMSALQW
jgi:hypothetical protein